MSGCLHYSGHPASDMHEKRSRLRLRMSQQLLTFTTHSITSWYAPLFRRSDPRTEYHDLREQQQQQKVSGNVNKADISKRPLITACPEREFLPLTSQPDS